jgi:hypothetical protein
MQCPLLADTVDKVIFSTRSGKFGVSSKRLKISAGGDSRELAITLFDALKSAHGVFGRNSKLNRSPPLKSIF